MDFVLKEATLDHISILTQIIKNSFKDVAQKYNLNENNAPTHPWNCSNDWIITALKKGVNYYLLEFKNIPIGCVALEIVNSEKCYLERLAVLPEYRKKGFGKILVDFTIKKANEFGINRIEIGIIAKDLELTDWYKKLGFVLNNITEFNRLPFKVAFMSKKL